MPAPLLIHVHVPKCAGTTIEKHLLSELGPAGMWRAPKRTRGLPLDVFARKYDATLPGPADGIRAISGHFIGRSVESLFPGRRIIRSMILREPESLMLSYYNFRMMRYIKAGQKPYSFALFMQATRADYVAHFLLERWLELPWIRLMQLSAEKKAALLDEALASIEYIADIRDTDALTSKLFTEIGVSPHAPRRNTAEEKQVVTGWKILRANDLSAAERALLEARTGLDRYLWRRWAQKEKIVFDPSQQNDFARSELARPRYQIERRFTRAFG